MEYGRKLSQNEIEATRELRRLATDFRRMLQDREACKKQTLVFLTNQKKYLTILNHEREELKQVIILKEQKSSKMSKAMLINDIKSLLQLYDKYVTDENQKALQLAELKDKIKQVTKDIHEYSSHNLGSLRPEGEHTEKKHLESFLAEEATRLKQILMDNRNLQAEVNSLITERLQFNRTYNQAIRGLVKGKKMLNELIDRSNDASESRRKLNFKIETYKVEAKKLFKQNCFEFNDLEQELRYHEHENNFLRKKSIGRRSEENQGKEIIREMTVREAMEKKLMFYNSIIRGITGDFGPDDLERVINTFMKIEDDNFQLYSFLSDHKTKITAIVKEVQAMEKDILDNQMANERKKNERIHYDLMTGAQYADLQKQFERQRNSLKGFERSLEEILKGATVLFNALACDWVPFHKSLGKNDIITPFNLNLFLRVMEKRLNLICTVSRFRMDRGRRTSRPDGTSPTGGAKRLGRIDHKVLVTPCPFCVDNLDLGDSLETATALEKGEIYESARKEVNRQRWRLAMHNFVDCPLPQAQRNIQRKTAKA